MRAMTEGAFRSDRQTATLSDVVVLKLGGSHALGSHLTEWLGAIAAEAGSVVGRSRRRPLRRYCSRGPGRDEI